MKKSLLVAVSVVMVVLIAVGGTFAMSSSGSENNNDDSNDNTATISTDNISVMQIQHYWNGDVLTEGTKTEGLYPYVGTMGWENTKYGNYKDGAYRRFTFENALDKYVTVKNTGDTPVYVRTFYAIEMGKFTTIDEFKYKIIGYSYNASDGAEFDFENTWEWAEPFVTQIDGNNYCILMATYKTELAVGGETIPSLLQIYLNKDVTNDDVAKLDGNDNGTHDLFIATEYKKAQSEFNTTTGYHPWESGSVQIPTVVNDAEELQDAIDNGNGNIILGDDIVF